MYENHLKIVRQIQAQMPFAALGGSLGLLLQGCDLKRNWVYSDIDLIAYKDKLIKVSSFFGNTYVEHENIFSGSDFQFSTIIDGIKIELSVQPRCDLKRVLFEGHSYLVQEAAQIVFYKEHYAAKNLPSSQKHIDDLVIIYKWKNDNELNYLFENPHKNDNNDEDDLPF